MPLRALLRFALLAVASLCTVTAPAKLAAAETNLAVPAPTGQILLSVSGLDPAEYPGGTVAFDRAALETLAPVTFTTTSIWTEGEHSFTGVPLRRLTSLLGVTEGEVLFVALNDYSVAMPLDEAEDEAPILAFLMDGKPMSVRDKGPIWVIYPYDSNPDAYQTETAFGRSVWQLSRIEVSPRS